MHLTHILHGKSIYFNDEFWHKKMEHSAKIRLFGRDNEKQMQNEDFQIELETL